MKQSGINQGRAEKPVGAESMDWLALEEEAREGGWLGTLEILSGPEQVGDTGDSGLDAPGQT